MRLRGVLGGMAQTLPCSPAAFLAPCLVSQAQTWSELVPVWLTGGFSLIENFPGHLWLLGTFHLTLIYYYIFKDAEI